MKILHVITGLNAGGAENMLSRIVTFASEAGDFKHIVVSLKDDGALGPRLKQAGIEVHALGMGGIITGVRGFFRLCRLVYETKPDAIISWLYHADLITLLACLCTKTNPKRLCWNIRCAHMDFKRYAPTTRLAVKMLSILSYLPGAIAHNSREGKNVHEALGYRNANWMYLPNGFDGQIWAPDHEKGQKIRTELNIPANAKVVIMVGRNDPAKDYRMFLEAARNIAPTHPEWVFLCAGKDTHKIPVPGAISKQIILLGERPDMPDILKACDLFVLCSAFGEGFPNVVGEAMLTSLPCIVTNVWSAREVIKDTGDIIQPGDSKALSAAIEKNLTAQAADLESRGAKAREVILTDYSLDSSYRNYRDLWIKLANPPVLETDGRA